MYFRSVCLILAAAIATAGAFAVERSISIDRSQSSVEVDVKATVDSFVGHLGDYDPSILIDDAGVVKSVRFMFRFADLATGKPGRDKAMHKWQQTERYPDGEFVLTSLIPASGATADARGRLTLHGITREIQFPVTITRDGARYAIDGSASIDTREYGLPGIRMFAVLKVDPVVRVRFHLQGAPEAAVVARP